MFRDQNGSYVLFAFIVYYCFKIINVPIAEYRSALDTAQMPFHHRDPQRNSMQGCSYEVVFIGFLCEILFILLFISNSLNLFSECISQSKRKFTGLQPRSPGTFWF